MLSSSDNVNNVDFYRCYAPILIPLYAPNQRLVQEITKSRHGDAEPGVRWEYEGTRPKTRERSAILAGLFAANRCSLLSNTSGRPMHTAAGTLAGMPA